MSLKKKLNRVFEMGFQLGVASTTEGWNGEAYGKQKTEEDIKWWEERYLSELNAALKEFEEYADKNRL